MLKNHFIIAWRVLKKNRMYSLLNVLGLTIGIAGFLMIVFFVVDEQGYDRFYGNSAQVYRITSHWGSNGDAQYATAPPPLGAKLGADVPEIEAVTRLLKWNDFTVQPETGPNAEQVFRETSVFYAEPNFFDVFDFELIEGNVESFAKGNGLAITETTAKRYFGNTPPHEILDKSLLMGSSGTTPVRIAAIVKDLPAQSHFHFDMLIHEPSMHQEIFLMDNWMWSILHTYAKIREGGESAVAEHLNHIVANEILPRLSGDQQSTDFFFALQRVQDIHLNSHLLREHEVNGYQGYVNVFSAVAAIILLLASINFMNLSTAKGANRSMEVGVRKVMGSGKFQLIGQFLAEALILVVLSTIISLFLIESFNGLFNEISGKQIHFNVLQPSWLWLALPALIVVLTLMAGFYPAFYLSSFKPIKVLRGAASPEKGSIGLRSGLVVFQFAISLVLIISALVVQQQLGFIQHTDVGFDRDQLLVIHNDGEVKNREREDFKRRISSNAMFKSSSFSTGIPLPGSFHMRGFTLPESNSDQGMNWYEADEDFVPTLDLKLKEGRNFSNVPGADRYKVLVNERAAHVLGIGGNAIGQRVIKNQGAEDEAELEVVGVLGDFNFESLRTEIKPLVIEYLDDYYLRDYITVRVNAGNFAAAIEELQQTWKQFEPRVPMNYTFLDQDFEAVYHSEIRMGKLMNVLTLISILIALLGLFGLTAYSVQQRSKEIGIRKVFGAETSELFLLLSGSYFKLIGVAVLLAVPTAYLLMGQWLGDFAFRVPLRPGVFLISAVACFGLALLTVLFQTIKSIGTNPVRILKNE